MKQGFKTYITTLLVLLLFGFIRISAQQSVYEPVKIKNVESSLKDFGKMWTFDDVPVDYFEKEYGFKPSDEWLEDVQKSALQFGGGCSGAFVSEDGLIMTNHHCVRGYLTRIQKENEDLLKNGFYAEDLSNERKVPGAYVDRLVLIKDVTEQINKAIKEGKSDEEKVNKREEKISELEKQYSEETGLECKVVTLYNGGKYSLYGYRRYNDIRLVMVPEFQMASTGWDWDNFTYPRYELDFAFLRAYNENGEPVKNENFFEWSDGGAGEGDPILVVGRPGNTDRLLSVAQLKYFRDYTYPNVLHLLNGIYEAYYKMYQKYPERESELLNRIMGVGNGRKAYAGMLQGLKDDYLMQHKVDFENDLKEKVKSDSELNEKYGDLWQKIDKAIEDLKKYSNEYDAFRMPGYGKPVYFGIAEDLVKLAEQKKLSNEEREPAFKEEHLDSTVSSIYPSDFDAELQKHLLHAKIELLNFVLGEDHELIQKMFNGKAGEEAVKFVQENSKLFDESTATKLAKSSPEDILNSDDTFITYVTYSQKRLAEISPKVKEIKNSLEVLNKDLGDLIFEVYGDKIPPDATATLRISDGRIKGYKYNGTLASPKTTYYGMYDRFNAFGKDTYPWGLTDKWASPPEGLDLATPVNISTTNDIVGGNSGSSAINKNAEIVGLVFDGNMESLAGNFIYSPYKNRTVAVDSKGLLEALKKVYKTERLVKELEGSTFVK